MEKWFEKYKRFFWAFFLLWLLLWAARGFGFDFGVELSFLFRLAFFLGLVWVVGEIRLNWEKIYPVLRRIWLKQKSVFSAETKVIQAEIIAFSPRILGGKAGSFVVLPLMTILLILRVFGKIIKKILGLPFSKKGALFLVLFGIFGDIFILYFSSNYLILLFLGLWIWSIRSYQFESRVSIAGGLVFLVISPFLLIFKQELIAEKAATWAYMFLLVGVIQELLPGSKIRTTSSPVGG